MAGAGKKRSQAQRRAAQEAKSPNSPPKSPRDGAISASSPHARSSPSQSSTAHSPPARLDGNRDPGAQPSTRPAVALRSGAVVAVNKNIDAGAAQSFMSFGYAAPPDLPKRPSKLNGTGRPLQVRLNTFNVQSLPTKPIYQYDVQIGNGTEKRGLVRKVWESKTINKRVGDGFIFDRNKIAYSLRDLGNDELRILVDLDEEEGKTPRTKPGSRPRENKHRVVIRKTKRIPFESLQGYLGNKTDWSPECLEVVSFLDHLLREEPSRRLTIIKRMFFRRGEERYSLGGGVEAFKGVYESMRPVSTTPGGLGVLSVNVDVANGTFWTASPLITAAQQLLGSRDIGALIQALQVRDGRPSHSFDMLRRFRRLRVLCYHRKDKATGKKESDEYVIDRFVAKTASQHRFKQGDGSEVSVEDYLRREYGVRLQYPQLPLVFTPKGNALPMELCTIKENQRNPFKLDERQTANMIKFAVTLPDQRWKDIEQGLGMLNWSNDVWLKNYGLRISPVPVVTQAKLLPNPKVGFAGGSADPKTSGRWDLRGKKFFEPHQQPLKSWGVCVLPGRGAVDKATVQNFIKVFISTFQGHGGKVQNQQPVIIQGTSDAGQSVEQLWNATGNSVQAPPQLLVFIVPDKNSITYQRIKKSTDCRYGVVSQVLQSAHVQRAQAQYCSNVAMKVNAKLGGATSKAIGLKGTAGWIGRPTLIIGADVSHGAPGTVSASIAAITMSWDRACLRYAAGVETNGIRVEMITKSNWETVFKPMAAQWVEQVGGGSFPQHVLYFRDGVSEGQYAHVLQQEVRDIREVFKALNPGGRPPMLTVVICSKRHHVRFFPDRASGDKNGNPQPGTLVEMGVTNPREYDFYLCAHSAIKGTARPVHYHVLLDEAKMGVEELQNMVYEASYQYVRSTTPVSLFPAVYYAHLASQRGGCHQNHPAESSGPEDQTRTGSSARDPADVEPLIAMPNQRGIKGAMWYV